MKRNSLRRLGALVLSLALTLSLAPPAWAANSATVTIDKSTLSLETGATSEELTATVTNIPNDNTGSPVTVTYEWVFSALNGETVTFGNKDAAKTTVTAGNKAGQGTITINVKWTDPDDNTEKVATDTCQLTITAAGTTDPGPTADPTVTITPPKKTTFGLGESVTLTTVAANVPAGANVAYQWTANGLTVKPVGNGSSCTLTGNTAGSFPVKVTMTVEETDGTMKTYEDTITLSWEEKAVSGLSFSGGDTALVKGRDDPNPWDLTVNVIPAGADPGDQIEWEIRSKDLSQDASEVLELPRQQGSPDDPDAPSGSYTGGKTVKLTSVGPGEVTVTARYGNYEAHKDVIVSGIVLNASETSMQVGETVVLAVEKMFGFASSGAAYDVAWSSSDPSTVTVINGELQAWKLGSAVITANKNGYTATCRVVVKEDEEAVISGISATTSEPLTFDTLYQKLSEISIKKTQVLDANKNELEPGSPLHYITNVKVPTEQGTLYYNYDSESNTGAGVGSTDRFAYQRTASIQQTLDKLYFVPKQGYNGVAEITLVGWAENGSSFSITVKVDVAGSQGIRYKTTSGKPAYFLGSDFNAYCRVRTGRDLSYVTFNLPQSSQGGLYYGYTSAGQYAGRVSTSTQYARTGRYTIDDVCFVPTDAFVGETRISYRCVDTSGNAFTGEVIINVTPSGAMGETATVRQTGQWGEPVRLRPELFNAACQSTIGDTLAYVRFQLPAYDKGALYYNYQGGSGSRVDSSSRYYYSGSPGLGSVTFVPASNGADQVAVPYTGYGEGGTSYTGTLYITLGEEDRTTVRYSIAKEETVSFQFNDFNEAALLQMGTSLEYIEFRFPEELSFGTLYYDYRGEDYNYPAAPDTPYYREPKEHWQQRLDRISFHAGTTAGSANIPFTAYSAEDKAGNRKSFQGTLVLQVGAASPADITLSGYTSGQFWLSAYEIGRVCAPVMNQGLSYIQITGLPDPEEGVVYYGYQGFKTGSEVKRGDRYYCMGAPNIDQVSFIPRGGFSGRAEITYIGYSTDGKEQVSGKIVLNVSQRSTTQLYNDMGRHGWAVDAVEFLSRNGTVNGVGGGRFNPTGPITKGDFVLMLVRAFGFKADGTVTYSDVPAGSYYAQAISIATQKGIASGWNGRFDPKWVLTRQEAMLMIYKALKADGHPLNNGLTADLDAFRDSKDIEPSARTAVGALILLGVVQGNGDGTLRPRATLSRAETASLMHRLMTMPGSAG